MNTVFINTNFTTSWAIPSGHATVTESSLRIAVSSTAGGISTYYSSTDGTTAGLFTIVQATASTLGSITALNISVPTAGRYSILLESLSSTDANKTVYTTLCKTPLTVLASQANITAGTIA